jgi:hypothetical protein
MRERDGTACRSTKHKKHAQTGIFFVFEGKGRVSEGEGGGEHVEHTCLGMFYVCKGKSRVDRGGSGEHVEHACLSVFYVFKGKSRVGEVVDRVFHVKGKSRVRWRTVFYVLKGKSGVGEDREAAHSESPTPA